MRHETLKLLYDVELACQKITQFIEGKSFDDYTDDFLLQSGVERQFEIIGEALNRAVKIEPGLDDSISDLGRIIAFRNFLIHAYEKIDHAVVWGTAQKYLPLLHKQVKELLQTKDEKLT